MCCTKKLFSTYGVKILEKYLWQCTFFSKVACWRAATLLKLTSFTRNFKGFWPQIQNSCKFWKSFVKKTIFCRTLRADFFYLSNHLRKFWEYFNSILTSYCTASVRHCVLFLLTLTKSRLTSYVYIWLARNSVCLLKHKQTWPEKAVYFDEFSKWGKKKGHCLTN